MINIQDYRKRKDELTFILVDNPDQTHIPLKSPTVPLLRINYIHNVVLEVSVKSPKINWSHIIMWRLFQYSLDFLLKLFS